MLIQLNISLLFCFPFKLMVVQGINMAHDCINKGKL